MAGEAGVVGDEPKQLVSRTKFADHVERVGDGFVASVKGAVKIEQIQLGQVQNSAKLIASSPILVCQFYAWPSVMRIWVKTILKSQQF